MTTAIVAGGGIAGLLSAKLLARKHNRVLLIERADDCGGLLSSVYNDDGVAFDHGAHVLSETGLAEIDTLLYGDLNEPDWRSFNILRAGNWFGGAMNRNSPFPDARRIGDEALRIALEEIANSFSAEHESAPSTLADALCRRFGPTLAQKVAGPAVRKQLGVNPEHLHPLTPFAIRRLVCANSEESRRLKQDPRFSEPLAFTSYEEGVGELCHHYPRSGGIGQWVDHFVERLQNDGVEILCGHTITSISHDNGKVKSISLDDSTLIPCDLLAWTLPSAMLLRAADISFASKPPLLRPIGLFHLVFDMPFNDPNYHVTNYDETFQTFRITLYPNLREQPQQAPFNCTVEVVGEAGTDFSTLLSQVVMELKQMGIASSEAQLISSMVHTVPVGFPATTHDFITSNTTLSELAQKHLGNTLLLGRARCPPFFTSDVLIDVYRTIEASAYE